MRNYFLLILFLSTSLLADNISISLKNAPTAEILSYLAEENNKNIVLTDEIKTNTTLRLENSNFDSLLVSITRANNLVHKNEKGIYFIGAPSAKETSNHSAQLNGGLAKPKLITKTLKLYYAKASEVIESLTKGSGSVLSENGYLHFDERSNSLIIRDIASSVNNLSQLIKQLDRPTEQIAIEARIVTINSENLQELGVRWGMFSPSDLHHRFAGSFEGNGLATNNLNVNFPVNNAASAVLQVATINSRVLDLELSALEQENSVEIIASPRLQTTNKKPASIKQGTEIPYAIYNKKDEVQDIEFKEAVLGLEVTPHLSAQNQILLDLLVTQNAPNSATALSNGLITIDKQELNTQVLAKHGETIVLGGIFQHLTSKEEDRVPVLGSIPVIKRLFNQTKDKISKRELVIFVTPYIMKSNTIPNSEIQARTMQKSPPQK